MNVPDWLQYVVVWLTLGSGIWVLFERAEKVLKPDVRDGIARWLRNADPRETDINWPDSFGMAFDGVFGEKHLSWKCFLRSCVASMIGVMIMSVLYWTLNPNPRWSINLPAVWIIGCIGAMLNFVPDYVSLLESRWVIKIMSRCSAAIVTVTLLIVDVAATAAIFLILFTGLIMFLDSMSSPTGFASATATVYAAEIMRLSINGLEFWRHGESDFVGIFLYTTLFTSVWVWLYVGGGMVLKFIQKIAPMRRWFDLENAPLRSIGFVCNIGVTTVIAIVFLAQVFR